MKRIMMITIAICFLAMACLMVPTLVSSIEPAVSEATQISAAEEVAMIIPEYHVISAESIGDQIIFKLEPSM